MATAENALPIVPPAKAATAVALPAKVVAVEAPKPPAAKVAPKALVKKPAKRPAPDNKSGGKTAAPTPVKKPATPVAKPVAKAVARPAPKSKAIAPAKEKKAKLVRDSFTIPKDEYGVLGELKHRAGKLSMPIKKSELLRAGIKALTAMSDSAFLAVLKTVPTIKTGRPAKS
jgi:hypothetical protein